MLGRFFSVTELGYSDTKGGSDVMVFLNHNMNAI